jgi:hypothetical protein
MDEMKRLELIVEAVKYCQKVKKKGMPSCCWTKALREPIHFLWERRIGASPKRVCGPKNRAARLRSGKAERPRFGDGEIIYDHAIPLRYLQDRLLKLREVSSESVRNLLNKLCVPVLITAEEHKHLGRLGLQRRMPKRFSAADRKARYKAAKIKVVKNEL